MEEKPKKRGNPAWQKGVSANPAGRPVGSRNVATSLIRSAYQQLTENNIENMTEWLQRIAEDDPRAAFELMLKMSEFIIPKVARTELTGADGADIFKDVSFTFGTPINDRFLDIDADETDYEDIV